MSHKEAPMICEKCGATMNHHATKIDYSVEAPDEVFGGGVLEEIHTCPHCGHIQTRQAAN